MPLIRPRLTDYYDIGVAQAECDFAIPLLDEDLPLFVDPFLLWKSPSQQDQALHATLIAGFKSLISAYAQGDRERATSLLVALSECEEAGLGSSANRTGRRIGADLAAETLGVLTSIPQVREGGLTHIEIAQLLVDGIGKDRISDITCCMLKSFLIDYTIEQSRRLGIPSQMIEVATICDTRTMVLRTEHVPLPVSPATGRGVLLVPKRWLRYSPWISYDAYFGSGFVATEDAPKDRPSILLFNRANYGLVEQFVSQREVVARECSADALFVPISTVSAKRRLALLRKLPTGKSQNADKKYEDLAASLLASVLFPQLDFAAEQVRTDSGAQIRDIIFYNTRAWDFLQDIHRLYDARQIVVELKNVAALDRDHVNQLNRYLSDQFGRFGVLVTRHPVAKAIERNLIDLWAGQRRCLLVLTDDDLELMVTLFESRQRLPVEVLKRAYVDFSRLLPA